MYNPFKMRRFGTISLGLLLGSLLIVAAVWSLPAVVDALPSRVRYRIPPELLARVQTPVPTALPAPVATAGPIRADLLAHEPAAPTPTLPPTHTPAVETPAADTPTPTIEPSPTATATPSLTPTPTLLPPPPMAHIDGLRIIGQRFNNCGPANLTMVLNYYGHQADQLEVAAVVRPMHDDRNVSPWELTYYANEYTPLQADYYAGGDLALLKRLIAAGFPVIVEKGYQPRPDEEWLGHYLTLVGYNDETETFTGFDTLLGPWDSSGRPVSYEDLWRFWENFNHIFIVVYPPEEEATIHALLGPVMLDEELMWRNAGWRAQQKTTTDPDNPFAWFNLGSSLTRLGMIAGNEEYFASAAAAFDQARSIGLPWRMLWYQFDIYAAYLETGRYDDVLTLANTTASGGGRTVEETFYYRGRAHLALGNEAAARADYRRALELNPNFAAARQALEQLDEGS